MYTCVHTLVYIYVFYIYTTPLSPTPCRRAASGTSVLLLTASRKAPRMQGGYRVTSFTGKGTPLGPYRRSMLRVLGGS